jgi:hypothetical protein
MPVVRNTYTTVIRITLLVACGSVLALGLMIALRAMDMQPWMGLAAGAPLLLASVIALPILWVTGRAEQRRLQAVVDGRFLAHWTYSQEECRRFAESEWKRTIAKAPALVLSAIGVMSVAGAGYSLLDSDLSFLNGLLLGGAAGVVMGAVVGIVFCAYGWNTRHACITGPAEAYVGSGGVYQHGRYVGWDASFMTLHSVKLESGEPSVLAFEIQGNRGGTLELRVAVPAGKEAEAERVLDHFPHERAVQRKAKNKGRRKSR